VLEIHGTADRNVPYNGGQGQGPGHITTAPIPDVVSQWRRIDACGTPVTKRQPPVTTAGAQCAGASRVVLISIDGAGHQWPGSVPPSPAWVALAKQLGIPGLDQPSNALDATQRLCEFFGLTR
jgi:polyhydroxybutyrate depolymerase